jgi:hypothetical protein
MAFFASFGEMQVLEAVTAEAAVAHGHCPGHLG